MSPPARADLLADAVAWIVLLWVGAIGLLAVWSSFVMRWPAWVWRVLDRALPLPANPVPGPRVWGTSAMSVSRPAAVLRAAASDSTSPRRHLIETPSHVDTPAAPVSSVGAAPASASSGYPVSRSLALSLEVEAMARALYRAGVLHALDEVCLEPVLPTTEETDRQFAALTPRVRESYRAAAELALQALHPAAHAAGLRAARLVMPAFDEALAIYRRTVVDYARVRVA